MWSGSDPEEKLRKPGSEFRRWREIGLSLPVELGADAARVVHSP